MQDQRNKSKTTVNKQGVQTKQIKPPAFKKAGFGGDNPNDPMARGSCKRYFEQMSVQDQEAMLKAANGKELKLNWAYDSMEDMFAQLDNKSVEERDKQIAIWEQKVERMKQQEQGYGGMICFCNVVGCDIGHFIPLEAVDAARRRY